MTDIVKRLGKVGLCGEAREEILRLRAEVAERPSKQLWQETADSLETLRKKFHEQRELLRDIRVHGEEAEGVSERLDAALGGEGK